MDLCHLIKYKHLKQCLYFLQIFLFSLFNLFILLGTDRFLLYCIVQALCTIKFHMRYGFQTEYMCMR